jgi:hypothetical protein
MSGQKRAPFEFHELKIDPKPGELPDFVGVPSSEPPDFIRGDARLVTENIGPDDIYWPERDAEGQLRVPLPKLGYERYSPFELELAMQPRDDLPPLEIFLPEGSASGKLS